MYVIFGSNFTIIPCKESYGYHQTLLKYKMLKTDTKFR